MMCVVVGGQLLGVCSLLPSHVCPRESNSGWQALTWQVLQPDESLPLFPNTFSYNQEILSEIV